MLEPVNPLSVLGGARAFGEGTKSPSPARGNISDDAVAVVIQNPLYTYQSEADAEVQEKDPFLHLSIEDTLAAVQKKIAELKQLAQNIRSGRFSARQTGDKLEADAEDIKNNTDTAGKRVYSDASELLTRFKEEIGKIRSFDGFLLGVHEKIEQFKPQAEFDLDQVQDVEQHMAEVTEKLELGVFSLARVRDDALKALRCQDEPQSDRVFKLLEIEMQKPNAGPQPDAPDAAPAEQNT